VSGDDDRSREALARLMDRVRANPAAARKPGGAPRRRRTPPEEQRWSGPGPDERDPVPITDSLRAVAARQGWERTLQAAGIAARWDELVGPHIAAHCRPERLEGSTLTCVAESTAWATQIRLLSRQLLGRLAAELGPGVVTALRVHGPSAPDWRHGPLRVTGRGPRDTYG
jgi:predicted nucleic acid-binding Zn ribbon protein